MQTVQRRNKTFFLGNMYNVQSKNNNPKTSTGCTNERQGRELERGERKEGGERKRGGGQKIVKQTERR